MGAVKVFFVMKGGAADLPMDFFDIVFNCD